jgi:hypothetical protein
MKPINLDYLFKVQKYCDTRSQQKEFGYNEDLAEWDDTPMGRIGAQLGVIAASIEEIYEIWTNETDRIMNNVGFHV